MKFAVFTHVNHSRSVKGIFAYAPYVREMNLWFEKVDEVEIVAPVGVSIEGESYHRSHLQLNAIPSLSFLDFKSTGNSAIKLPFILLKIFTAMRRADHIHLRSPGNIGLLACLLQVFFPNKPKSAKYAGNWDPEAKQPWSYKLQKWILANTFLTRNMTVLVYGQWQDQSKNILPFFTASFSESERGKTIKNFGSPYKFLFVGNLVPGKHPLFALHLVEALKKKNFNAELHVFGDGELIDSLKEHAKNKAYIHFHGNQPLAVLKQAYKDSHFLVLASKSEGWPKAVAEAMFFGCIPISTAVSCVPWMLGGGSRGVLISEGNVGDEKLVDSGQRTVDSRDVVKKVDGGHPPTSGVRAGRSLPEPVGAGVNSQDVVDETVDRLIELIQDPEEIKRMSLEAQEWSQEYTLERFEKAIEKILAFD